MFLCDGENTIHKVLAEDMDAAFALYHLDHDGAAVVFFCKTLDIGDVVRNCMDKAGREGTEFRVEAVLTGGG